MSGGLCRGTGRAMTVLSRICGYVTGGSIALSAALITYEVIWRYFLTEPHTWSLEVNVFLLIGATFLASSFTQLERSHVGTEVLDLILPKRWIPWRILFGDTLSCAVCLFIAVSVSLYTHQAWVEDWTTDSTWGPSLWIPFSLIAAGMWLTVLQFLVQIVDAIAQLRNATPEKSS